MVIEDDPQFGAVVAAARKALRLTQRDLALAINSGERFIVDLEAGRLIAQLGKALTAAHSIRVRLAATGNSQAKTWMSRSIAKTGWSRRSVEIEEQATKIRAQAGQEGIPDVTDQPADDAPTTGPSAYAANGSS